MSSKLRDQLLAEARAAFPRECCGLIEGVQRGSEIAVLALHPTRNLAAAPNRFEIDPAAHIRLARSLRGTGRAIIGCYHSHPDGLAQPSAHDRERAQDEDFVWLIAGSNPGATGEVAAYLFRGGAFLPLVLA